MTKMTRVKFRTSILDYGVHDVFELDARQAAAFVKSGHAELTTEPVGRHAWPICDECGSEMTDDDVCWSVRCRGAVRPRAGKGAA